MPVNVGQVTDAENTVVWEDFRLAAVEGIEGVEFYADPLDAPIEFRDGGRCAVLAIWRREVGPGDRH